MIEITTIQPSFDTQLKGKTFYTERIEFHGNVTRFVDDYDKETIHIIPLQYITDINYNWSEYHTILDRDAKLDVVVQNPDYTSKALSDAVLNLLADYSQQEIEDALAIESRRKMK